MHRALASALFVSLALPAAAAPARAEGLAPPPPASATAVVGAAACPAVVAAPGRLADPCCTPGTRWHVTLGAWIWGVEGTVGNAGREASVSSDWTDTLEAIDKLEFALNARLRVEWGRWAASVEVDGAEVADSATFRRLGTTVDGALSLWTVQAQLGYGFAGGRLGCDACSPVACAEVYGGARLMAVDASIGVTTPGAAGGVDGSKTWVDPLVGLRGELRWPGGLSLLVEADVGGFGVGSDLAWHVLGAVRYAFSRTVSVGAGWKVLDVDYAADGFTFDARLSGPFVALTLSW